MHVDNTSKPMRLEPVCDGVWKASTSGARIIDRSGRKRLPIGDDGFISAVGVGTLVDKTMLVADVLGSGYKATLFCRPRRFGKTLNITMLKAFLEASEAGGLATDQAKALFRGTDVWEADDGAYRQYQGIYPVVSLSLRTAKGLTWKETYGAIRNVVRAEYLRHAYLREAGSQLAPEDVAYFNAIAGNVASEADYADSLLALCRMLRIYHQTPVVVLIDEYDAPVMAGYTNGYYDQVVSFLKRWLTGALKDGGEALAFACLTGVQRISKESVFSDLNNLVVSTPLTTRFDERFGFTDTEVQALATYLGHPDCMPEARRWYDGYRFGNANIYNPWSVIRYLGDDCQPDAYWGNTSSNSVLGALVSGADAETLEDVYSLLQPDGVAYAHLNLGVVFPDLGIRDDAMWSMLYLAGYLTTDDVEDPSDDMRLRALRIPNLEIRRLFRNEVLQRFIDVAGGNRRLFYLHRAFVNGDAASFCGELSNVVERASYHDLTNELSCHMLLMGLLFGVPGYHDPLSNREAGYGRYDIRLEPDADARVLGAGAHAGGPRPLITVELKYLRPDDAPDDSGQLDARLRQLAEEALSQIADKGYDAELPEGVDGRLRWGVAFCGKRVAAVCARA